MEFLALFVSLPTRQSAGRMRIWRALRALGCATLRDGVYLLPESPQHAAALARIAAEAREVQGMADLYRLGGRDEAQQAGVVALFDRCYWRRQAASLTAFTRTSNRRIPMTDPRVATTAPAVPTLGEAFKYWLKLGFISFGGPAGQIAMMHQELVERRRWTRGELKITAPLTAITAAVVGVILNHGLTSH